MNYIEELQAYLGDRFDEKQLVWNTPKVARELKDARTAERWFKSKAAMYLYAHLGSSQWRRPYTTFTLEQSRPCEVLDYHAGAGAFGLALAERGYDVSFADTAGHCTRFLKWRVKHRELDSKIYDINKDEIPRHKLVISFDRIEQYPEEEQFGFIQVLASLGGLVIINLNTNAYVHDGIFYPVDVDRLRGMIGEYYTIARSVWRNHYQNLIAFRTPAPVGAEDDEGVTNG